MLSLMAFINIINLEALSYSVDPNTPWIQAAETACIRCKALEFALQSDPFKYLGELDERMQSVKIALEELHPLSRIGVQKAINVVLFELNQNLGLEVQSETSTATDVPNGWQTCDFSKATGLLYRGEVLEKKNQQYQLTTLRAAAGDCNQTKRLMERMGDLNSVVLFNEETGEWCKSVIWAGDFGGTWDRSSSGGATLNQIIQTAEAERILSICTKFFEADPIDMEQRRRYSECVNARHATWIILADKGVSLARIGRIFDFDHTAIRAGTTSVRRKQLAEFIPQIKTLLEGWGE